MACAYPTLAESRARRFRLVSTHLESHCSNALMNFVQRFLTAVFPKAWAEAMRADSERWKYQCSTCGGFRSVWEAGGVRWNANTVGKRVFIWCPACQQPRWSKLEYHRDGEASESVSGSQPAGDEKLT